MSNNTGIWQATFPNCPKTLTCGEWFRKKKSVHDASRKKLFVLVMWRVILKTRLPIAMQEQVPRLQTQRLHYSLVHHPFIFSSLIKLIHWFTRLLVQCVTASLIHWLIDSKIHRFIGSQVQLLSRARILSACHSHLNHHVLNRSCPSQRQPFQCVCIA